MNLIPQNLEGVVIEYIPYSNKNPYGLTFHVMKGQYMVPIYVSTQDLTGLNGSHPNEMVNYAISMALDQLNDYELTTLENINEKENEDEKKDET